MKDQKSNSPAASEPCESCPAHNLQNMTKLGISMENTDFVAALAGNPNTGKSTVFNSLTGLRQHTGNWPGKTVARAEGAFAYNKKRFKIVDLPGTYSLLSTSVDEEVARNFILFGQPDATVVVVDATRLERNLNLLLQVLEITDRAVLCVNLMDEARRNRIDIDARTLSRELGIPVVLASARRGEGIPELLQNIFAVANGTFQCSPFRMKDGSQKHSVAVTTLMAKIKSAYPLLPNPRWVAVRLLEGDQRIIDAVRSGELIGLLEENSETSKKYAPPAESERISILKQAETLRWELGDEFHDAMMESLYTEAARIADLASSRDDKKKKYNFDAVLDKVVTSKWTGFPVMFVVLAAVFWLTVIGANYPSQFLSWILIDKLHPLLRSGAEVIHSPWWLTGLLIDGAYVAGAWVVSVMLPPMMIFFPLFTLAEDFGYLPRVAFNMDNLFRRAGAHGKQALTMTMGFGCNAAGVVAARIIDSPRERLIAIITNNFSLCNGRWPAQIVLGSIFVGAMVPAHFAGLATAAAVVTVALTGIALSLIVSWTLSHSILKGESSAFSLELPPYRPPQFLQLLYTSLIDRTMIVLWRAVVFAFPAGAVIWCAANITIGGVTLAEQFIQWVNPFALLLGLNGVILLAYIIAIPANEIVLPTILMLTALSVRIVHPDGGGVLMNADSVSVTGEILRAGGWTALTGVNVMIFSLIHNPCSTTIVTIYKETQSAKWTAVAAFLPLLLGFIVCFFISQIWKLFA